MSANASSFQPPYPRMGPLRSSNTRGSYQHSAAAAHKPVSVQSSWSRQTLSSQQGPTALWKGPRTDAPTPDPRAYGSAGGAPRDLQHRPLSEQLKAKVQFQNLLLHPDSQPAVQKPHIRSLRDHFSENTLKKESLSHTDRKKPFRDGLFDLKKQFASSRAEKTHQLRTREGGPGGFSRSQPKHTRTYQALSEDRNASARHADTDKQKHSQAAFSAINGPGNFSKRGTASEDYGRSFLLDSNQFFSGSRQGGLLNIPTRGHLLATKPNTDHTKPRDTQQRATLAHSHLLSKHSLDRDDELSERLYDFDDSHQLETTGSVVLSKVSVDSQKQLPTAVSKQRLAPVTLDHLELHSRPAPIGDPAKSALAQSLRKADRLVFNQDPVDKIFHVADKKKYYGGNQFYKRMAQTKSVDSGEGVQQSLGNNSHSPVRPQHQSSAKSHIRDTVLKETSFVWKRTGPAFVEAPATDGTLLPRVPRLELVQHTDSSTDAFSTSIASSSRPQPLHTKAFEREGLQLALVSSRFGESTAGLRPGPVGVGEVCEGDAFRTVSDEDDQREPGDGEDESRRGVEGCLGVQPFRTLEAEGGGETGVGGQQPRNPSFKMDNTGFTWAASRSNRNLS